MEIEYFLANKHQFEFANKPCLYIVKQEHSSEFRCGASGTKLYKDADAAYGSSSSGEGLEGRLRFYNSLWRPLKGKIYAAMPVKRQLVADGRTSDEGYSIDRPTKTLVKQRESEFHAELDNRGLRSTDFPTVELFKGPLSNLIASLRMVKGSSELYLFDSTTSTPDPAYRVRRRRPVATTTTRQQPARAAKVESIVVRLSKAEIDQLKAGSPAMFQKLVNLVCD